MATSKVIPHDSVISGEGTPGVTVSRIVTKEAGATKLSTGITSFAPGKSNTTHFHNAEESVIVIEGEGVMLLQGEEHHLKRHDAVFVTPGTHHRFTNTGNGPFTICWAYSRVDVSRTLVDE